MPMECCYVSISFSIKKHTPKSIIKVLKFSIKFLVYFTVLALRFGQTF